jgi:hypothetical protein
MFIATTITTCPSSVRSETKTSIHIALLRSYERQSNQGIYKHFIPTGINLFAKLHVCSTQP